MAQEVEHILGKDEVTSSNLVSSSKKRCLLVRQRFFGAGVRQPCCLGSCSNKKKHCFE